MGLDLYIKLLEQAILDLKGEAPAEAPRATLHLKVDLRIPEDYVPDAHQRMSLYKRLSQLRLPAEMGGLRGEVQDRYGPLPPEVDGLLTYAALRLRASLLGLDQVDWVGSALHLRWLPAAVSEPARLVALVREIPGASLSPQGVLRVPTPPEATTLGWSMKGRTTRSRASFSTRLSPSMQHTSG